MRRLALILLAVLALGCRREPSYPYHQAVGAVKVEGREYYSVLIVEYEDDGIHVVGGFISDGPLGKVTVGGDNSQNAALQIIPSQSIVVHSGKTHTIADNGLVIWIVGGQTYEQTLVGFPLEEDLTIPESVRRGVTVAAMRRISQGMEMYRHDHGEYPADEDLPQALTGYKGRDQDRQEGFGFRKINRGMVYGPYNDTYLLETVDGPRPDIRYFADGYGRAMKNLPRAAADEESMLISAGPNGEFGDEDDIRLGEE